MSAKPPSGAAAPPPPAAKRSAPVAAGPKRPAIAGGQSKADPMARYRELLRIGPAATLDEINTAYFTVLKRFPENPTEADEEHSRELRRAYDMVRRRYVPPKTKGLKFVFDKRVMLPLLGVAVLALGGTFLWLNWKNVKMKMTHYEAGAVLRLKDGAAPFGTVTGYEASHKFPAGAPAPAYSIKLDGKEETVWVSERLVVLGMVPAGK